MRRTAVLCLALALAIPGMTRAQAQPGEPAFQAVISGPTDITVGRTVVLDGSLSRTDENAVEYAWYVNDVRQPISRSVEALYTPEQPGPLTFRLVMSATDRRASEATLEVTVYRRKIVLVVDPGIAEEKVQAHVEDAESAGTFLRIIRLPAGGRLGFEDEMTMLFAEQRSAFVGAEIIALWSDDSTVLQALMRTAQSNPEILAGMRNQTIMLLTGRSLNTLARTARGPFTVLRPTQILVTRPEATNLLTMGTDVPQLLDEISRRDIDVLVVNAATSVLRPWNVLTSLVNFMRVRGVSSEAVILLLVLPFIATILAFLKQVVGITTFGLYTPSIIAVSFLALGWAVGLVCLAVILGVSYGVRELLRRWRLLYIPKVAIILSVVSLTLLFLLAAATYFSIELSRDTIFMLLIMSTLSESFLNLKAEEGWSSATFGILETIGAAILCVMIVQWSLFQSLILAYPELVLVTLVINAALGRWTGLRLVEYFRFREVFRHLQEEE